jgi:transcriptional regulator with XRE-family HTH domain
MKHLLKPDVVLTDKKKHREIIEVKHNIRAWRQRRNMSMKELAHQADLSSSAISQLERGRAHYTQQTLEKIAEALQLQPWQLLVIKPARPMDELLPKEALEGLHSVCKELAHNIIGKAVTDYWNMRKSTIRADQEDISR